LTVKQKIVAMVDGQAGKGSKPRQVDQKKWDDGWERTFGKKKSSKLKPKKKKVDKK